MPHISWPFLAHIKECSSDLLCPVQWPCFSYDLLSVLLQFGKMRFTHIHLKKLLNIKVQWVNQGPGGLLCITHSSHMVWQQLLWLISNNDSTVNCSYLFYKILCVYLVRIYSTWNKLQNTIIVRVKSIFCLVTENM